MRVTPQWRSSERLAWTEKDGFERPPSGVSVGLMAGVSVALLAGLVVVVAGDSLCPEHRSWVRAIAVIGIGASLAALAALVRQSAASPLLAMAGSVAGCVIGGIDSFHEPVRGMLVMSAFGLAGLLAAGPVLAQVRTARWARRAHRSLGPALRANGEIDSSVFADDPPHAAGPDPFARERSDLAGRS